MVTPPARRKRTRRSRVRPLASALLEGYLALLLAASVLAIGSVHVPSMLVISAMAALGLAAFMRGSETPLETGPALLALSMAGWCLLQAIPLPIYWVEVLSPSHAHVYHHALAPLPGTAAASLTFDRGATLVEGLKWSLYAIMFLLGAHVTQNSGLRQLCLLIFGSGVALGVVTLLHGLLDAEHVFGFYSPTTRSPHWALSPLVNPNNLAGYLNLATFAGLGPMLTERTRDVSRWMALGIIVTISQSILTGSRGGVLTLLFGVLLTYPLLRGFLRARVDARLTQKALRLCFLTVVAALVATWLTGPEQVWRELQNTSVAKLKLTQWAFHIIEKFPLFGVGAGAFEGSVARFSNSGEDTVFTHPENFVLAWLSEFGIPAGAFTTFGLLLILKNSIASARRCVSATCALLGVAILLLQNFFDLAFAVPGVMTAFCMLLGGLRQAARDPAGVSNPSKWKGRTSVPRIALTLLCATWTLTLLYGRHTAERDRRQLFAQLAQVDASSAKDVTDFYGELSDAMRRHPADAYLRRLGASAALSSTSGSALAWAAASLELAPAAAETHLLVAHSLHRQGRLLQGLLELKIAAQYSSNLTHEVAAAAVAWTKDERTLLRVVPDGRVGTDVLVALARQLDQSEHWEAGIRLLEQALQRSQQHAPAHALLLERLLKQTQLGLPPCETIASACLTRAEESLRVLESLEGHTEPNTRRRAKLLDMTGRTDEAFALLISRCPTDAAACLRLTISFAQKLNRPIDNFVRTYRALTCIDRDSCIRTHEWLGHLYATRREHGTAIRHYSEAAQLRGTSLGWLNAARQAEALGSLAYAARMAQTADRLGATDPALLKEIAAIRERIANKTSLAEPPSGIDLSTP